jgi:hypothetical protein
VKRKLKELIMKQLEADKTSAASLPRSWEDVLWEQISDEISSFFSNTDGLPTAPSAKALLVRAARWVGRRGRGLVWLKADGSTGPALPRPPPSSDATPRARAR